MTASTVTFAMIGAVAAICATQLHAQGTPPQQPASAFSNDLSMVDYHFPARADLYRLSRQYFLPGDGIAIVERLNHIRDPHRIPTGSILKIPLSLLRTEPLVAHIAAVRGDVRVTGPVQTASLGAVIPPGTTLETGADGFVTLEMPNGSRTSLPTRSRLRVLVLRRVLLTGRVDYDLEVSAGKAETEATPIAPGTGSFRIRTPHAVSAVRGTRFRVGFGDGQSEAEVLEGLVGVGAGTAPAQDIPKGFGAAISDAGAITKETLLPAPDLLNPGRVQVDPEIALHFAPVAGAAAYHLQVAEDAAFLNIVAEATTPSPDFVLPSLANGTWFVRGTAISPSHIEGMQQTYTMRRVLTGLTASASGDTSAMHFNWSGAGDGRRVYHFQLMRDSEASLPIIDEPGLETDGLVLRNLAPGIYFWRLGMRRLASDGMTENWVPFEKLTVAPPER